jgi:hypothetical protein
VASTDAAGGGAAAWAGCAGALGAVFDAVLAFGAVWIVPGPAERDGKKLLNCGGK